MLDQMSKIEIPGGANSSCRFFESTKHLGVSTKHDIVYEGRDLLYLNDVRTIDRAAKYVTKISILGGA